MRQRVRIDPGPLSLSVDSACEMAAWDQIVRRYRSVASAKEKHPMQQRSTREVFEDHLQHAAERDFEADLHNFTEDCVILTGFGVFYGHDGIRETAEILERDAPGATYT